MSNGWRSRGHGPHCLRSEPAAPAGTAAVATGGASHTNSTALLFGGTRGAPCALVPTAGLERSRRRGGLVPWSWCHLPKLLLAGAPGVTSPNCPRPGHLVSPPQIPPSQGTWCHLPKLPLAGAGLRPRLGLQPPRGGTARELRGALPCFALALYKMPCIKMGGVGGNQCSTHQTQTWGLAILKQSLRS